MAVLKKGLDYFPLSTEFDDRVKLIIGEFGMKGLGILIKLWQKVYNSEGYYCKWSKDVALLFSCECRESNSVVSEVLNCCLRREIFDKSLFEKYSILTSKGIQKRYFEACLRRKSVSVKSEYLLLSESEISDNVSILIPNESILNENAAALKQSKIKESKIKDNKGKDKPKN
ncbi:MAG: DUF4373 domain-containing protein, partial [Clostridiales bacterium]|nr:DUF4373 domain-containing protein [Clostridiales bacterium]